MKKKIAALSAALCLLLTGCANIVLERSYSNISPHSETYWENQGTDTLRADSYPDLVNAMLLLLGEHAEDGTIRIYGDDLDGETMAHSACAEVQDETAMGSYLLDYITYTGAADHGYYELSVHFGYRRTQEEYAAIINATSTEALPELVRSAAEQDAQRMTVRIGYFSADRASVEAMLHELYTELTGQTPVLPPDLPPEEAPQEIPWRVVFYPDTEEPGIAEFFFTEE